MLVAEELLDKLRDEHPDVRIELIAGEIVMSAAPLPAHGYTVMNFGADLIAADWDGLHVIEGPRLVISNSDDLIPDLVVCQTDDVRSDRVVTAELVIEVLSPSTADRDRGRKRVDYAAAGIRDYWLVDPAGGLTRYVDPITDDQRAVVAPGETEFEWRDRRFDPSRWVAPWS